MKKKVTLYLKNGSQENLYPVNDSQYTRLIENLESGDVVNIDKGGGVTKTIRSNNIEWWETENIKEVKPERIFKAGGKYYHEKAGRLRFITEEEYNSLKKQLYR